MWNIIQCAVRGQSHIKSNIPCQDKTYSTFSNDTHVIALADGAGSAKFSHFGAESVTKWICSNLNNKFDDYFYNDNGTAVKQEIIENLLKVISEKADELGCETKALASTLMFVAIKGNNFILAHIGDGIIGYLKDDELKVASYPENGEFINTTVFITSNEAIATMKLIKGALNEIQGFVLLSDGAEVSLYNKTENKLADVVKKIMQISVIVPAHIVQDQLRLSFENVVSKFTTDDCSIIILTKIKKDFNGYSQLTYNQKLELLKLNAKTGRKQVRRYDEILSLLTKKRSLQYISRKLHLKDKYAKKYLDKLCSLNFVNKVDNNYQTILIMDTKSNKY